MAAMTHFKLMSFFFVFTIFFANNDVGAQGGVTLRACNILCGDYLGGGVTEWNGRGGMGGGMGGGGMGGGGMGGGGMGMSGMSMGGGGMGMGGMGMGRGRGRYGGGLGGRTSYPRLGGRRR